MAPFSRSTEDESLASDVKAARSSHRPKISYESSQVIVIDDFLDDESFCRVLDYCGRAEYRSVHSYNYAKVWRINDGYPLQSNPVFWQPDPSDRAEDDKRTFFPTGTELDLFIEQLLTVLPAGERLVGKPGEDWADFTAAPWVYPQGAALSLHQDGFVYSGAYTYFAHREWNIHWGGYLLVLDPATPPLDNSNVLGAHASWMDDGNESQRTMTPGFAQCIFPKPNRLVFIASEAQHLLSRVDANAGLHPRVSIAGFFRKRSTSSVE